MAKRSERIEPHTAGWLFEEAVRRPWTSLHWSFHTIEQNLAELINTQLRGAYVDGVGAYDFVAGWMRWKAERTGMGYFVLDVRKAEDAATLAKAGLHLGLLSIDGRGPDLRLRRVDPGRRQYQRLSYGGGLALPPMKVRERMIVRHAAVAAPIIEGLLRAILAISPDSAIPNRWIEKGFVPPEMAPWKLAQAFGILKRAHHEWAYEARHVLWIAELRCYLIHLGGAGRPEEPPLPVEDAEALAGLAA